jgi:hypothetical protein
MILQIGPSPCWRVIATLVPGTDLFGGITDFSEWEAVAEIENLWNERSLGPLGNLAAIPREQRAHGPGSAYIMSPFAFRTPGRFGDGSFGVLYAGLEEQTALAEVAWHRARFMREWELPRQTMDYHLLGLVFEGSVEDLRASRPALPGVYAPDSWVEGQALGARIRATGADGIAYASVRHLGGECLAGFRPNAFSRCHFLRPAQFFWDGRAIHGAGLPGRLFK